MVRQGKERISLRTVPYAFYGTERGDGFKHHAPLKSYKRFVLLTSIPLYAQESRKRASFLMMKKILLILRKSWKAETLLIMTL